MSEFWFWFIRPMAEVLGVIAMICMLLGCVALWAIIDSWRMGRKRRKTLRARS